MALAMFLGLLCWAAGRGGRRAAATTSPEPLRFPLLEPVELPAAELERPWSAVPFDAWFELPVPAGETPRELRLAGLALRVADPEGGGEIKAYCRLCPHELCWVDLDPQPDGLPLDDGVAPPSHPLLVCPCHFSLFDPVAEGACLSGPSPRGLYRFWFERAGDAVRILEIEESALGL